MTVSQLGLTCIQRQTRCEKPRKDTKQNTNTHRDPYFFTPTKATEDLERNKEKGQLQNSCIVRSNEVGQEDEQEWIWQNSSKSQALRNGSRVDNLFVQHSIQELWATKASKSNHNMRCSSHTQQNSEIAHCGTLWTLKSHPGSRRNWIYRTGLHRKLWNTNVFSLDWKVWDVNY